MSSLCFLISSISTKTIRESLSTVLEAPYIILSAIVYISELRTTMKRKQTCEFIFTGYVLNHFSISPTSSQSFAAKRLKGMQK